MFLLLPRAILELYRKEKTKQKEQGLGFFFSQASLMSPGALPCVSVGALITVFHFFNFLPALQSNLHCVLALLGGVLNPHILFCCCSPQELNRDFSRMSYKLALHHIGEQGNSLQSLVSVSPLLCSHAGTKCHCLNVTDSLHGCKGPQNTVESFLWWCDCFAVVIQNL